MPSSSKTTFRILSALDITTSLLPILFPPLLPSVYGENVVPSPYRFSWGMKGPLHWLTQHKSSRHSSSVTLWEVINIEPLTVYLIYNCHYMRDICKNADNFEATPRGRNLHPISGLPNNVYGYDLNSGDNAPPPPGQTKSRQESRRDKSCPRNWKNNHRCPETDQQRPMRHDGEWFTTAIEAGSTIHNLQNQRDAQGNVIRYSNIRYTCDEFPPATW